MIDTIVDIDRMPLTFVTTPSERAELVWRRARDALITAVPAVLELAIEASFGDDDAYVFIDRLDVSCAIRSDWAPNVLGSAFAEPMLRALEAAWAGRDDVVRFTDRAEYLGILAALVIGGAHGRWWFSEFDGLRPLPVSAAVRTIVVQEGTRGWQALAQLTPDLLRQVLLALQPADVEAILHSLASGQPTVAATRLFDALNAAPAASFPSERHRVLFGMIDLQRSDAGPRTSGDATCLGALAALIEAARNGRLEAGEGTIATVFDWCDAAGIDAAGRAAVLDLDVIELFARVSEDLRPSSDPATHHAGADHGVAFTPFGGAMLLAVTLVRSGRWHAWQARLERVALEQAGALASSVALQVVARAMLPRRPGLLERDAVLWRAFGGGAPTSTRVSREMWQAVRAVDTGSDGAPSAWLSLQARQLLEALAQSVPGCAGSTSNYLRTRLLSMPASVSGDGSTAQLGRAPLDVLLQLSGLTRAAVVLPDGRRLTLTEDLVP